MPTSPRTRTPAALALVALALWVGCSDRPKTVAVHGRVTLDGGPVPHQGVIYFTSTETARPGMGHFDEQGEYVATTWHEGDGLLPGKYQVHLECWQQPPNMEGIPVKSYLPSNYMASSTSGLELVVDGNQRRQVFDIEVTTDGGDDK
jgi:hypothetical protein